MTTDTAKISRKFWRMLEAIHTVVYLAPEASPAYKEIGLAGYWSGYFASRSAPLGEPSAELVTATFFGFAPAMVARAIPNAWELADRKDILSTREGIAVRALESIIGGNDIAPVADALLDVTDTICYAGRPLAAAHHALAVPQSAIGRLWHATSVLREYRGDGHIAVLTAADIGPVEANIVQAGIGKASADQQARRGWSDEEWAAGADRLMARGWLDAEHALTDFGRAEREAIEVSTDASSNRAISHLIGTQIADSLLDWARTVSRTFSVPAEVPAGVPAGASSEA